MASSYIFQTLLLFLQAKGEQTVDSPIFLKGHCGEYL